MIYKFTIAKPKTPEQELEKLDWESKLATYGNNISVESLMANNYITYELDIEEDELNSAKHSLHLKVWMNCYKFTNRLYWR